jgi:hypothetical protein
MFDWTFIIRQLVGRMLRVLGKFELSVFLDRTFHGGEGTGDEVEKGGFTRTVISYNGDSVRKIQSVWVVTGGDAEVRGGEDLP